MVEGEDEDDGDGSMHLHEYEWLNAFHPVSSSMYLPLVCCGALLTLRLLCTVDDAMPSLGRFTLRLRVVHAGIGWYGAPLTAGL